MRIEWSEEAAEDLESLYAYYSQWNLQGAAKIYNQILDGANVLLTFPKAGKVDYRLLGKGHSYRTYIVHKYFELIYYIEEPVIYIAAIWNCQRNPERLVQMLSEDMVPYEKMKDQ